MGGPLEGIKVVDIGWIMVGPVSARYLTELGASTIKIESGNVRFESATSSEM